MSLLLADRRDDLLDQRTAALFLRASRSTLFRLRRSGQLEAVHHGGRVMYRVADLARLREDGWEVPGIGWNGFMGDTARENIRIPAGCK